MTHAVKFRTEDGVLHDHAPRGARYRYEGGEGRLTDAQINEAGACPLCWPPRMAAVASKPCIDCAMYRAGGLSGKGVQGHFVGRCKLDRTLSVGGLPKGWPTVRGDRDTCDNFDPRRDSPA